MASGFTPYGGVMLKLCFALASLLFCVSALAETKPLDADIIAISAGSSTANGIYSADMDFQAGSSYTNPIAINTDHVVNAAPMAVYQSNRHGPNFIYTLPGLIPGVSYLIRLHFAEIYFNAPGLRTFSVTANNVAILNNFDIFTASGGEGVANVQEFQLMPDNNGNLALEFVAGASDAQVNGIEVQRMGTLPVPTPSPTYNLSLTSDKTFYTAGNKATVVASLSGQPSSAEEEFFVSATFAGSPIGLTGITKTQSYAITPALSTGNSLFTAQVFLQNSREASAYNHAIRHFQEEIAGWQADLVAATDPNEISTLNAEISHDQDRLVATQEALARARTPVGAPVNLILATH
jgi:hypothetical protein